MPKLRCEALKCIYNCEKYCAKSVIHVNDDFDAVCRDIWNNIKVDEM